MSLWVPDYLVGGPWYENLFASLMYWVRRAYYGNKLTDCACEGCGERIPKAWATIVCIPCALGDCEHEDDPQRGLVTYE